MNKVSHFFTAFLPIAIAIGIQIVATVFLTGFVFFHDLITGGRLTAVPRVLAYAASGFGSAANSDELTETLGSAFEVFLNSDFNAALSVIYAMIAIVVFGLWYYMQFEGDFLLRTKRTSDAHTQAPARPTRGRLFLLAGIVLIVPAGQLMSNFIVMGITAINPVWLENYEKLMELAGLEESISPLLLLYAVILAPVCEELIFRGVTMRSLRSAVPFWLANLIQALLFGIFHMNMIQGSYAFALGLILGIICEKCGHIYYSMFLHFVFNLWGTLIGDYLEFGKDTAAYLIFLAVTLLATIVGIVLIVNGSKMGAAKQKQTAAAHSHEAFYGNTQ